jgi:hypothetical protein
MSKAMADATAMKGNRTMVSNENGTLTELRKDALENSLYFVACCHDMGLFIKPLGASYSLPFSGIEKVRKVEAQVLRTYVVFQAQLREKFTRTIDIGASNFDGSFMALRSTAKHTNVAGSQSPLQRVNPASCD